MLAGRGVCKPAVSAKPDVRFAALNDRKVPIVSERRDFWIMRRRLATVMGVDRPRHDFTGPITNPAPSGPCLRP